MRTSTKKRILFIHASADLGGTEVTSLQLATRLNQHVYEPGVLFNCSPGPLCSDYQQAAIPFWTAPLHRPDQAWRVIRNFQPDIIQIYGLKTNVLWRPLLYARGYQNLIGIIQGLSNTGKEPSLNRIFWDRLTHSYLRYYVANSRMVYQSLINRKFDPRRLKVIYNGVDIPSPRPSQKPDRPPRIICVGNLRSVKGHVYLLESLKILQKRGEHFEAWIVGDGPLRQTLVALTEKLQLSQQVKFIGRIPDVHQALEDCDLFASMSLSEGLPTVLMEAMAQGLPVVATDVGGVSELIRDREEGFLVPSKDIPQAAARLALLLTEPERRQQMGAKGRARVEALFNLKQTIQNYEQLYSDVTHI